VSFYDQTPDLVEFRGQTGVGFAAPDDASVAAAIEANDVFVAELERIRDAALQTLDVVSHG
jgi:hypothetical protein